MIESAQITGNGANAQAGAPPGDSAMRIGADGRLVLIGGCCTRCATRTFPAYIVCPACMAEEVAEEIMPRQGIVYSYSIIRVGPPKWKKPFTVGYVDLENGVRVFAHLRGVATAIGSQVELDSDSLGCDSDGTPITSFVFRTRES